MCPGAKGVHGWSQAQCCLLELLSLTLVLKSSPINLQMEIGDIHFKHFFFIISEIRILPTLTLLSMCAQTWCSSLFVRLVGWLSWAKVISLPFLSSTPPSTFFTRLAAPSYLQTPWSQDNKIP